jgi:endonuclease/exonuclease/phosphatase family metal-dependent hydrolase
MKAGRGDLPRLASDLVSGRLTGLPVLQYVLLLQEAVDTGERGVNALARTRRLSAFFVPIRGSGPRATGNAIVTSDRLVNARAIDLPRERQNRVAVAATIEVDDKRLFVVSVHLENRVSWLRGGLFADRARGRQVGALLRTLPPDGDGVVGGDFNTWLGPNEPAWRMLYDRFVDTPRERPEPTFRDRLVLDHLFFDLPEGWKVTRRVIRDRYGSDHNPVIGVMSVSSKFEVQSSN